MWLMQVNVILPAQLPTASVLSSLHWCCTPTMVIKRVNQLIQLYSHGNRSGKGAEPMILSEHTSISSSSRHPHDNVRGKIGQAISVAIRFVASFRASYFLSVAVFMRVLLYLGIKRVLPP